MFLLNNYKNKKKVLLIGNIGFKGKQLTILLSELKANIYGVSLEKDCPSKMISRSLTEKFLRSYYRANLLLVNYS